ncbi:MAG: hypothetical protein AAF513_18060 [Pseudomonadota bacterium]
MAKKAKAKPQQVEVENVNHPGQITRVDATKYQAVRTALLAVLPSDPPGLTQREMIDATAQRVDQALFPGGAKAGWWVKTVQLDLEAKGVMRREASKPLRWYRLE